MKKRKSCLIVDDNHEFATMLATVLRKSFEVSEAYDAYQAHQLLGHKHFDVIVCDIQMPILGGIELASQLKKKLINIPVIFITGDANGEVAREALEVGAANVLQKPFDLHVLESKIEAALSLSEREEYARGSEHELGHMYNLLKSHYYDIQDILYQIQYYKIPASVVLQELDKKQRMGRCHLDDPEYIKLLGSHSA